MNLGVLNWLSYRHNMYYTCTIYRYLCSRKQCNVLFAICMMFSAEPVHTSLIFLCSVTMTMTTWRTTMMICRQHFKPVLPKPGTASQYTFTHSSPSALAHPSAPPTSNYLRRPWYWEKESCPDGAIKSHSERQPTNY